MRGLRLSITGLTTSYKRVLDSVLVMGSGSALLVGSRGRI